ncbi:MAG: NAD-dependent epimerase/dehydratase family protein, partial [Planctomycetota bacterium]
MRILLTGAEGFAGSHLRTCLESRGHEVVATTRDGRDGLL